MDRILARIVKIDEVINHPDAHSLDIVKILGWKVVVKKNDFKVGDEGIYFEIDSFLPIKPEYEFLRKTSYRKLVDGSEGFRLKTIRLRKQISQGLVIPNTTGLHVGSDVTELLGVTLWVPNTPTSLAGDALGVFPSHLFPKTDAERIQNVNMSDVIEKSYYISSKLEGTSFSCYYYDNHFGVCSRNQELKPSDDNLYWKMARKYKLEENYRDIVSKGLTCNIAIQGEIIGPGIQGNHYRLLEPELRVFGVIDLDHQKRLSLEAMRNFCLAWKLPLVPIINDLYFISPEITRDEIIKMADGKCMIADVLREGLIFQPLDGGPNFKAISNEYLLKHGD
jgi:RNA ligase (TIGR02306 family)